MTNLTGETPSPARSSNAGDGGKLDLIGRAGQVEEAKAFQG